MNNKHYFYRNITFTRKNNRVALADIDQPDNTSALDEWMGVVVTLADGEHTIQELIDYIQQRYQNPPSNLEKTLHSIIERLEEGKIIQLSEKTVTLPYYLASPIEELDLEKARQLMKEDRTSSK
jgi:iron-sulfur cluster repair protein YtfE (RIC family)